MERRNIINKPLNRTAIRKGEISACREVREHFIFPEGCRTIKFEVCDVNQLAGKYKLEAKRRTEEKYAKEAIAGLKTYIRAKGLVEGDRIIIFKLENDVRVLGKVLIPSGYYIDYEKAAQGGGNFAGVEAGEN